MLMIMPVTMSPASVATEKMRPADRLLRCGRLLGIAATSNENKMSDGGRGRASRGVEMWKSSQKWSVQRSAVRSIAWLGQSTFIAPDSPAVHLGQKGRAF